VRFGAFHLLGQHLGVRHEEIGPDGEPDPAAGWLEEALGGAVGFGERGSGCSRPPSGIGCTDLAASPAGIQRRIRSGSAAERDLLLPGWEL
jgi:hypothetical protein